MQSANSRSSATKHATLVDLSGFLLNAGGVWDPSVRGSLARVIDGGGSYPVKLAKFAAAVRQERPDVIHCWHTPQVIYPWLTWPLHRRPIVVNVRDVLSRSSDTGQRQAPLVARLLAHTAATVANAPHLLDDLAAMGVRPRNASVIENGIVLPEAQAQHRRGANEPLKIAGIGALKPLKNWPQLLRVAGLLRQQGHAVEVTIFGEGPARPELEAQAAALGFDPKRVFPGFSLDAGGQLPGFDLLLHPSLTEGLPNAVLEALAAGVPAVASALPCYDGLRRDGDWVRVYPVDDDAACVAAMLPWLEDAASRRRDGSAARQCIARRYGVDAMAARFVEVYRDVVARSGR